MKIEEYRASFFTAIVDSAKERRELLASQLSHVGYRCAQYSGFQELEKSFETQPPHFLFFSYDDPDLPLNEAIESVKDSLPETHIFLLSPAREFTEALGFYEKGIYDCLSLPLESPLQLVRAVDRAAQLNYFYYQNEQLNEKVQELESSRPVEVEAEPSVSQFKEKWAAEPPKVAEEDEQEVSHKVIPQDRLPNFRAWLELLYSQPRQDHAIQAFFRGLEQLDPNFKAVFFKYIPQRRTIMAAQWVGYQDHEAKSVGLNFNDLGLNLQSESLREPNRLEILNELATSVFKAEEFRWECLSVLGEIQGLFLFSYTQEADLDLVESYMSALQRHVELLELEKRLHSNSLKDPSTQVLNRHTFLRQVSEEVSRARRVQLPTSILVLSLDQYFHLTKTIGSEDTEVLLRALARIFTRHSRVNDVIGRVGSEQFAMILPHTPADGAMIKAERLRKIVESADFSKIIKGVGTLTISLAVSEYPSLCADADELFQSADEALFQLKSQTSNKIAKALPPEGFRADFAVKKESS